MVGVLFLKLNHLPNLEDKRSIFETKNNFSTQA
jgi:hypothetical protein